MDKSFIDKLSPDQRGKMAVAYLMREKGEQPEELKSLFEKLEKSERSAASTNNALMKTNETMMQLQAKFHSIMGSIDTLSEMIAEGLEGVPEETIMSWCEKYTPPQTMPNLNPPAVDMAGKPNIPANVDMAGSTSHEM